MTNLRTVAYGAWIAISTAVAVTGIRYWDEGRINRSIRAEDAAELYAAMVEKNVAYQTGTNANPSLALWPETVKARHMSWYPASATAYGTNTYPEYMPTGGLDKISGWLGQSPTQGVHAVGGIPLKSFYYERLLGGFRDYVTASNRVFWTDPATLDDTLPLCGMQQQWYMSGTSAYFNAWTPQIRYYSTTNAGALFQSLGTTATRTSASGSGVRYRPGIADDLPLAKAVYGDIEASVTNPPPWASGNWWTARLGHTNVYGLRCETDAYTTNVVEIVAVTPSGMTMDPGEFSVGADGVKTISVEVTSVYGGEIANPTNYILATVFEARAAGLASQRFPVSDYGGYETTPVTADPWHAVIEPGDTVAVDVLPREAVNMTLGVTAYADVTVDKSSLTFYATNRTPQTITVTGTRHGAGLVRLSVPGNFAWVAVSVTDPALKPQLLVPLAPVFVPKQGTAVFTAGLSDAYTNFATYVDTRIMPKFLDDARGMSTNLTQTLMLFGYDELNLPTHVTQYVYAVDGLVTDDDGFSLGPSDAVDIMNTSTSVATNFVAWTGAIAAADVTGYANHRQYNIDHEIWYTRSRASAYGTVTRYLIPASLKLPYPSQWACSNAYVARVRAYAVFGCGFANKVAIPEVYFDIFAPASEDELVTYVQDPATLGFYDDKDFGLGITGLHGYGDAVFQESFSARDRVVSAVPTRFHISQLLDVANPSAPPSIPIPQPQSMLLSDADVQALELVWTDNILGGAWEDYDEWWMKCENEIRLTHVLVVVDWNWRHLNGFVPAAQTPPWNQPLADPGAGYWTRVNGVVTNLP